MLRSLHLIKVESIIAKTKEEEEEESTTTNEYIFVDFVDFVNFDF